MKRMLQKLIEKHFDIDAFQEAIGEEIKSRIDYDSIACSLLDRYEDEFAEQSVNAAEEYIPYLD